MSVNVYSAADELTQSGNLIITDVITKQEDLPRCINYAVSLRLRFFEGELTGVELIKAE